MNDILSSISLLVASISIFYSIWFPDFKKAKSIQPPDHYDDGITLHNYIKDVLWKKAFPILIASCLLSLIFIPISIDIIANSFSVLLKSVKLFVSNYDPIATTIVLANLAILMLAFHSIINFTKIRRKDSEFKIKKNMCE